MSLARKSSVACGLLEHSKAALLTGEGQVEVGDEGEVGQVFWQIAGAVAVQLWPLMILPCPANAH